MNKLILNKILIIGILILTFTKCNTVNESLPSSTAGGDWLIPADQVFDGGPGQDGIPALTNPEFGDAGSAGYLGDADLVIGVKVANDIKAFPHPILDWHEIINDDVNGIKMAITYCPLTGSGIAWSRIVNQTETTFGVSGLLYNTNLIPYDRLTSSRWSQMKLQSVNGELKGTFIKTYKIVETTWKTWRSMYPATKVVTTNTGYSRSYGVYPYGDYKTNNSSLLFPVNNKDTRLPQKERVLGVLVNGAAKAYKIGSFGKLDIISDNVGGENIVVAGSSTDNFIVAYNRSVSGTTLEFTPLTGQLPLIMKDNLGNKYDIFGVAIEGPNVGAELRQTTSYIAYWFAWAAFYPKTDLLK